MNSPSILYSLHSYIYHSEASRRILREHQVHKVHHHQTHGGLLWSASKSLFSILPSDRFRCYSSWFWSFWKSRGPRDNPAILDQRKWGHRLGNTAIFEQKTAIFNLKFWYDSLIMIHVTFTLSFYLEFLNWELVWFISSDF